MYGGGFKVGNYDDDSTRAPREEKHNARSLSMGYRVAGDAGALPKGVITVTVEFGRTIDLDLTPDLMKALNIMTGEYLEILKDIETVGEYRIKGDWENTHLFAMRAPSWRRR